MSCSRPWFWPHWHFKCAVYACFANFFGFDHSRSTRHSACVSMGVSVIVFAVQSRRQACAISFSEQLGAFATLQHRLVLICTSIGVICYECCCDVILQHRIAARALHVAQSVVCLFRLSDFSCFCFCLCFYRVFYSFNNHETKSHTVRTTWHSGVCNTYGTYYYSCDRSYRVGALRAEVQI